MLETHGIPVQIDWRGFKIGTSVFVPGVDQQTLHYALRRAARRRGFDIVTRSVVERGMLGVRMWRV